VSERVPPPTNDLGSAPNRQETRDVVSRGVYWTCFAVCAVLTLLPLWSVKYPPMVDLPQHAAQISIWKNLHDPRFGFAEFFELELRTPYLATYALARLFAEVTSILVALKLVISLSVVGLPLALQVFLRRASVSRWWSLIGFPLAYGYSFRWGFLSFMVGVPATFLFLAVVLDYARRPTARLAALVAGLALALFWIHVLVLLFCAGVATLVIVSASPGPRAALTRVAPLAGPLPLLLLWTSRDRGRIDGPMFWGLGVHRVHDLFALYGYYSRAMPLVYLAVVVLVITLRARGPGGARPGGFWPLALAAALVLFWPFRIFGTAFVSPRFSVFLLPFLIAWLRPAAPRAVPVALVSLTALVSAFLVPRFRAFEAETRDYDAVAARIAPRPRIRPLIFLHGDDFEFLHFPAWTQADKGGLYGFSFASSYTVARYKPSAPGLMGFDAEHHPEAFDFAREAGLYDHFVVHADAPDAALAARLFHGASGVSLVGSAGAWHVFRATP
jgi:hypothetical protein